MRCMTAPAPTRIGDDLPRSDAAIVALDRMFTAISYGRDSRDVHRHARAIVGIDLDVPAYTLLVRVHTDGASRISTLAEALGLDLSTVSRKVARIEEQGLLQRTTDPADARAVLVDLTHAGVDAVQRMREARREHITEAISHWTASDRARLGELVDRLLDDLIAHKQHTDTHGHANDVADGSTV